MGLLHILSEDKKKIWAFLDCDNLFSFCFTVKYDL